MAVEKERAIAENELANRIELARREEELVSQAAVNDRRKAESRAEEIGISRSSCARRGRAASPPRRSPRAASRRARLQITCELGEGGTVFGDGIEADRVAVDWGQRIEIGAASRTLRLVG
jgi:hypothetical protein